MGKHSGAAFWDQMDLPAGLMDRGPTSSAPSLGASASSRVHPSFSWLRLFGLISGSRSTGAVSGIKQKMPSPGQSWFVRKVPRKDFWSSEADFGMW